MKIIFLLAFSCLLFNFSFAQKPNPAYDSALAKKLGADEFGMKHYIFVILKTGSETVSSSTERDSLFAGHLANIKRLADAGELLVAGPFGKNNDDFRGLFILNTADQISAEKMLATDPAIKAGLLKAEMYPWYGSAALPEYLPASEKVWKTGF